MMKLPMSESPPCKKPRLGDSMQSKPDMHMPLRIDTDRARSVSYYLFIRNAMTFKFS